jgi:Derlin-2/3
MDYVMGGPGAAAQGVTGAIVGHLWWWLVFGGNAGTGGRTPEWARAPAWLRSLVGDHGPPRVGPGVEVIPPRQPRAAPAARSTGYNWGTGNRLGTD